MDTHPLLLIDVDEVLFPFAHAYDGWLRRRRGHGLEPGAMRRYAIAEAAGADHAGLAVEFVNDRRTIQDEPPVDGARDAIQELSRRYRIVACTSRRSAPEGDATWAWISLHLPAISEVLFTSTDHGDPLRTKGSFARELGAQALIDDTLENLSDVPSACRPILLRRPAGLDSHKDAVEWDTALLWLVC